MRSSSTTRRGDELGEHPTATDALELVRVTDQNQTPLLLFGELDEVVQVRGREHARFVDDQRGARRESPFGCRSGGSVPVVEQFGDRVGGHAGVAVQHPCRLRRRGEPHHRATVAVQVGHRRGEHARLPRTRRPDDHCELVPARNRCCGVALHHVEAAGHDS